MLSNRFFCTPTVLALVIGKSSPSSILSVLLVVRELHSMSDWWVEEAWGSITTRPPLASITLPLPVHYITTLHCNTSSHKHYITVHYITFPYHPTSSQTLPSHCIALHSIKKHKNDPRTLKCTESLLLCTLQSLWTGRQKIAVSSIRVRRC